MPNAIEIPFINLSQSGEHPSVPLEAFADADEDSITRAMRVRRTVENAAGMVRSWQMVAKEAQRFYDGHQWEDYDRMLMQQSRRPILTFNEIKKIINSITGLERLNRTDVRFVSRAIDSQLMEDVMGDLATEACSAIDELSEAQYERSLMVKDCAITGMGWMEAKVSFDMDLDGEILKERVPWDEMYWDIYARRSGLVDARWVARKRNMPREIFKKRWPDKIDMVDASAPEVGEWTIQKYELVTPYYSLANEKVNPQVGEAGVTKHLIPVIQFQEGFEVPVYRIANPSNPNDLIELSEKSWKSLKKEFETDGLPLPAVVRQTKILHRQIYVAHGVELEDPTILPGNRRSLMAMTGIWDEEKKMWVGFVPDMIDPQKTKNKALSTALHFYLTNAKGGVVFETGTWKNATRAKDEWSQPNPWIEVEEGKMDKWRNREPTDLPPALTAFFEIGTKSITEVMGFSQEMLGMAQGEVSNPTQRGRLAAGLAILGWFFDEIDRFKKDEARTTLEFVREFATDGQLIQIGGPFNSKAIPLLKSNLPLKYRLVVDESIKHNPNLKAQIWQDLQPIIPAIMRFGGGKFLLYALRFTNLPAQLIDMMTKEFMQQQQSGQGDQQGRGKKEPPEMTQAKIQQIGANVQKTLAQAKRLDQEGGLKIAELFLEGAKLASDMKHKQSTEGHKQKIDVLNFMREMMPGINSNVKT